MLKGTQLFQNNKRRGRKQQGSEGTVRKTERRQILNQPY